MVNQMKGLALLFSCCLSLVSVQSLAYTRCATQSSGLNFQDADVDFQTARNRTINDCTSSSSTTNGSCFANVRCDGDDYGPNVWISCRTTSSGLRFEDGSSDLFQSANKAVNNCTSSSSTINGSCFANVVCASTAGQEFIPFVKCSTQSNGLRFEDGAADSETSRNKVINDCTSSSSTTNGQCRANVVCRGGPVNNPSNYFRCTTQSAGLRFQDGSEDYATAVNNTVNNCTSSASTNNGSCNANVSCVDGPGRYLKPFVKCTTESNGLRFEDGAPDANQSFQRVINDCTSSSSTNNGQCRANVYCDGN